jgi:hypothetical protein
MLLDLDEYSWLLISNALSRFVKDKQIPNTNKNTTIDK